jgi:hypothetical protein
LNKVFDSLPLGYLAQQPPRPPPEALASFDRESSNQIQVRFPETGSVIESRGEGVPIPLVMVNAVYPMLAVINDLEQHWVTEAQSSLMLGKKGSYSIALVDANGQTVSVSFVLEVTD